MSYEGAMLGGYLLPEQEFILLMEELLKERDSMIQNSLNQTLKYINNKQIKEAYSEWNIFFTQVLKNPTTSLLAIVNFYSSTNQTWTFIDDEENALMKSGGMLNIKEVEEDLKREYTSSILTKHLSNLFKEVSKEVMENDEIQYLYALKKSDIYKQLNPIKYGTGVYIYKKAIYGELKETYYRGKVADAYLNHLGANHWDLLDKFSKTGQLTSIDNLKNKSVKQEERAVHSLNFVKLLMASMNRTSWYTGGDLIVTGTNGKVLANIQIKTSANEGEAIGSIRVAELQEKILKIKEIISSDHKQTAKLFFNLLKTSSVGEQLEDAIIQDSYKLAKENLQL